MEYMRACGRPVSIPSPYSFSAIWHSIMSAVTSTGPGILPLARHAATRLTPARLLSKSPLNSHVHTVVHSSLFIHGNRHMHNGVLEVVSERGPRSGSLRAEGIEVRRGRDIDSTWFPFTEISGTRFHWNAWSAGSNFSSGSYFSVRDIGRLGLVIHIYLCNFRSYFCT